MAPRVANLKAKAKFNEPVNNVELAHLGYMPKGGKYDESDKRARNEKGKVVR